MEKLRIRDPKWKKFGSGMNIPDPQDLSIGTVPTFTSVSLIDDRCGTNSIILYN
jgi:hypothetical protein